jgi:hypothetical protein
MSQKTSETKEIGGKKYEMFMLPPMESHNLLMDVVKMVGPGMGSLIGSLVGGNKEADIMEKEVGSELISDALSKLFSDLNKNTMEKVIESFKKNTQVGAVPLEKIFDAHFLGSLDEMYQWVAWGFKVQWGKSLSALMSGAGGLNLGGVLNQEQSKESSSPNT